MPEQPLPPRSKEVVTDVPPSVRLKALRELVKTKRDGSLMKMSEVSNQEPGIQYLWVNVHTDRRVYFEAMGWTCVRNPDKTRRFWDEGLKEHRRGDVVLYQIAMDEYEMQKYVNIVNGLEAAGNEVDDSFAAELAREGVKAFKPSPKGA